MNKPTRLCGGASASFDAKLAATRAQLATIAVQGNVVLASSLGAEDMVLLDLISALPNISAFVLDTGRLHAQTLQLLATVQSTYPTPIEVFKPREVAVNQYVGSHGLDAIFTSVELRKACCEIRKTEPLQRALTGKTGWITGLRRTQSVTRAELGVREWDAAHGDDGSGGNGGLWKFNPLLEWTEGDVWHYIDTHKVPYNPLHDQFMPSIGCAPCTRAITPGEDVRAGRWWWENPESKECGLHAPAHAAQVSIIPIREVAAL